MIAVSDLTDSTKPLEYDYPWLEDTVEPYTSNFDMLGICVCVCVCVCPRVFDKCIWRTKWCRKLSCGPVL